MYLGANPLTVRDYIIRQERGDIEQIVMLALALNLFGPGVVKAGKPKGGGRYTPTGTNFIALAKSLRDYYMPAIPSCSDGALISSLPEVIVVGSCSSI
eukprot:3570781-Amphidinium_carterae.2